MHLLALFGNRSKRAVSPVVSTILLIALTSASIGGVAIIMSNINAEGLPTANTDDASIGANSGVALDEDISIDLSIAKLSYNLMIFANEGKKYYTSITIQVDYTGTIFTPNYIYLIDFDIFVYGQKLDEVSSWTIELATGASLVTDADDKFAGFEQAKGSSATYVVEVEDPDNQESRIFEESNFQYQAKVGLEPGVITHQFIQEEVSKVQFNNVYYNIAIVHTGQLVSDPTSGIAYWLDALNFHNGSSNLFLLFNENIDLYDTSVLSTLNFTAFAEYYNAVIFAEWGIHIDAVTFATYMHEHSMPMLFAGTIADTSTSIDDTAQNMITGVTPNSHFKREKEFSNSYYFNTSTDYLLLGISGQGDDGYIDYYGYDAALLTGTNITQYGEVHIELYNQAWRPPVFEHTGPFLVRKDADLLSGTGMTITYIINHAAASHSQTVFRNMIFSAFHDEDRILTSVASMTIDSWVKIVAGDDKSFSIMITSTVIDGDIKADTLTFSLKMDKDIKWKSSSYVASLRVAGNLIENVEYTVADGLSFDLITIDIGLEYGSDIPEGSSIIIYLPQSDEMSVIRNTNLESNYDWISLFEWLSLDDSFGTVSQTNN